MVHFDSLEIKDVPGGIPKSDLLGVTVALIHSTPKESIHFEFRWVSTQLRLHFEYSLGNKVYTFFWSRVYM